MKYYRQPFVGEYKITQYYGETVTSTFHTGIDYACPIGTPILASADGEIRFIGLDRTGYGNCVIIEHDITHSTLYAHLRNTAYYSYGSKVKQGDIIGWSGNTGYSTGPHLHFEARKVWNDYKSHFDPIDLPLMSMEDKISLDNHPQNSDSKISVSNTIVPGPVSIVAPSGAFMHNSDFTAKQVLPFGTKLTFTGKTKEKDNLVFCECTIWIALNDGSTQILLPDNK